MHVAVKLQNFILTGQRFVHRRGYKDHSKKVKLKKSAPQKGEIKKMLYITTPNIRFGQILPGQRLKKI